MVLHCRLKFMRNCFPQTRSFVPLCISLSTRLIQGEVAILLDALSG